MDNLVEALIASGTDRPDRLVSIIRSMAAKLTGPQLVEVAGIYDIGETYEEGDEAIATDPTDPRSEHMHEFKGTVDERFEDGTYLVRDQDNEPFIVAACDLKADDE